MRQRQARPRTGMVAAAWVALAVVVAPTRPNLPFGTPVTRAAQVTTIDLDAAVDAWLAGDDTAVRGVQRWPAAEVRAQTARALKAWAGGDEGTPATARGGVRRTQALAALALQVLLDGQTPKAEATVWEEVTRAADARLARVTQVHLQEPGDRQQLARFRAWWYVTHLQFLHEARRRDFDAAVSRASLEEAGGDVTAEFHAIRGLRAEYMSRLATSQGPVLVEHFGGDPATTRTQDSRGRWMRQWLSTAESLLAEAVRRDPTHDEARLHRGRVALDRGRPDEAIERLAPLLRMPCADATCGLASLFTGEAHEQAGRLADADRSYALASSVPTVRPHALVALMGLAVRRGESSGAALTRHLESGAAAPSTTTAWNAYLNGKRLDPGAVVRRLRAAALGPSKNGG